MMPDGLGERVYIMMTIFACIGVIIYGVLVFFGG